MKFSIKSPKALLWKTGYNAAQLKDLYEAGKLEDNWLVCPLGESTAAVTIAEFIQNPSIFQTDNDVQIEQLSIVPKRHPMPVATMGWWVFFGALFTYFLIILIASELASNALRHLEKSSDPYAFIALLLKGLDALIIAGAITALLGHAYARVSKAEQAATPDS